MKKIIALRGKANTGKTSSIRKIPDILSAKYPAANVNYEIKQTDIKVIIEINGIRIGIESQGDPNSRLLKSLDDFVKIDCHVIVCATRTRGATVNAVMNLESTYEIVWLNKDAESTIEKQNNSNFKTAYYIVSEIESLFARST